MVRALTGWGRIPGAEIEYLNLSGTECQRTPVKVRIWFWINGFDMTAGGQKDLSACSVRTFKFNILTAVNSGNFGGDT